MLYPVIDLAKTGANIRHLRQEKGCSVSEIAGFMSFQTSNAIYKWERGEALPTVDHLFALSRLLGVSMNDILVEK